MNDSNLESEPNVRSECFSVVHSAAICPHCRARTRVVAVLLPPGHHTRRLDDDDDGWDPAPRQALLFYVESLSEPVRRRLQQLAPQYRFAASAATQGSYWANHCGHCGGIQEDHDLFCEPHGAFVPLSSEDAAAIEVLPVAERLEAAAAGYTLDPEFMGSGPRA
jgi:hypothetical protein